VLDDAWEPEREKDRGVYGEGDAERSSERSD
jgi:hypothetical protein